MTTPDRIANLDKLEALRQRLDGMEDEDIRRIHVEPMDMNAFVLVTTFARDGLDDGAARSICLRLGAVVGAMWPPRTDEYSWMVTVNADGQLIDAESGGWSGVSESDPA